jgi:hypothetical protein
MTIDHAEAERISSLIVGRVVVEGPAISNVCRAYLDLSAQNARLTAVLIDQRERLQNLRGLAGSAIWAVTRAIEPTTTNPPPQPDAEADPAS